MAISLLCNCTPKDDTPPATVLTPTMKYKANGVQYSMSGSADNMDRKGTILKKSSYSTISGTVYVIRIFGSAGDIANTDYFDVPFTLPSSSSTITPVMGSVTNNTPNGDQGYCSANGVSSGSSQKVTTVTVNITSNTNNKYSGTFSATLFHTQSNKTTNITEGSFENLSYLP